MRKYRPSNGTEGMYFIAEYCECCIHEKFMHTNNHDDKKCDILSNSMLYDLKDPEYPCEWQYNEMDKPICTSHIGHNWDDDDNDDFWKPTLPIPISDNQLCFPFVLDEIVEKETIVYEIQP